MKHCLPVIPWPDIKEKYLSLVGSVAGSAPDAFLLEFIGSEAQVSTISYPRHNSDITFDEAMDFAEKLSPAVLSNIILQSNAGSESAVVEFMRRFRSGDVN